MNRFIDLSHPLAKEMAGCWIIPSGLHRGDAVYDLSPNARNLAVVGTEKADWVISPSHSHGFRWNADGEYAGLDTSVTLEEPVTLMAWGSVPTTSLSATHGPPIVGLGTTDTSVAGDTYFVLSVLDGGYPQAYKRDGDTNETSAAVSPDVVSVDTWYHLCAVFVNDSERRIYVNGDLKATDTTSISNFDICDNLAIGAFKAKDSYIADGGKGASDILVWNRALSAGEVRTMYSYALSGRYPFLSAGGLSTEQIAAAIGGAGVTSVSFSMGASFGVSAQAQASAQASSSLAQSVSAGMDAAAASGAEVPMSHVESLSINAQASAPTDVALTATLDLATSSDVSGVVEVSFTMDMLAGLEMQADAGAAVSTALGMASGLSMAGSAQVDEDISADLASQIQVSETAHANAQVPFGVQATLATIADAVAQAGYTMDVVQTITITGSSVVAELDLPDGRTILVEAETRVFGVEDQDRIRDVDDEKRIFEVE